MLFFLQNFGHTRIESGLRGFNYCLVDEITYGAFLQCNNHWLAGWLHVVDHNSVGINTAHRLDWKWNGKKRPRISLALCAHSSNHIQPVKAKPRKSASICDDTLMALQYTRATALSAPHASQWCSTMLGHLIGIINPNSERLPSLTILESKSVGQPAISWYTGFDHLDNQFRDRSRSTLTTMRDSLPNCRLVLIFG